MRIVCLGEALVDLVCERPVTGPTDVDAFVPHFGGALANVAVQAARRGAEVGICGGVGDDPWGTWLRDTLRATGVDTTDFVLERGGRTPLALVTIDGRGEPSYAIYGSTTGLGLVPAADRIAPAVSKAGLVLLTSNTLLGDAERRLTLGARAQALAENKKVVIDANLRPNRWPDVASMRDATLELLEGAFLAKMNAEEATILTGEEDPVGAAEALRRSVARNVVITSGDRGAILRGEGGIAREVPSLPVVVRNAAGAGDAVTGVLLAALSASDGYAPALNVALPDAMEAAAAVVQRWGAT
ncbi:MAG: PfkB family carbohydrate kinase [Solirubrobacteraceae bacterium]|nr:PfkB family carbohydrate kinase [Patulibacter sp.]